jgi:hypothetical protein
MPAIDPAIAHEAISRLFELSYNGEQDNTEFAQLDALVYGYLGETYQVTANDAARVRVVAASS